MNGALLRDAFGHHVWATLTLLDACARLTPEQLATTVPGTYGRILATLRHFFYCVIDLLERLLGQEPTNPWRLGETTGL
ncbi:MAG: hypothetical protein LH650_13840, partial [Chloroflexi bacterium]|nr:hypothetical protein [Chloroflexota bacterium]